MGRRFLKFIRFLTERQRGTECFSVNIIIIIIITVRVKLIKSSRLEIIRRVSFSIFQPLNYGITVRSRIRIAWHNKAGIKRVKSGLLEM